MKSHLNSTAAVAESQLKIPTEFLPEGWKAQGAELFELKEETIRKIVNGQRKNTKVFDYFLALAKKGKAEETARLNALNELAQ